ncbi:MAG: TetR family transcriptional regulator [Pseudomonadota bacterium]
MSKASRSEASDIGQLNREKILSAALELVQSDGVDFSMRALGTKLDVWPMAVYRHYKNRDALLDAIVDAVLGKVLTEGAIDALKDSSEPWQSRLEAFCLHMYDVYVRFPGVAQKVLYGALYTPKGLELVEVVAGVLVDLGLDRQRAASILQTIGFFVCEMAMLDYARRQGQSDPDGLLERAEEIKSEFPIAYDYIEIMADVGYRDRLKTGLKLFSRAIESEIN